MGSNPTTLVVGTDAVVEGTVVDDVAGTVVDEVACTVPDDDVGAEAAADDPLVVAVTAVLDVARCDSEQPAEITARAVNPKQAERNRTRSRSP